MPLRGHLVVFLVVVSKSFRICEQLGMFKPIGHSGSFSGGLASPSFWLSYLLTASLLRISLSTVHTPSTMQHISTAHITYFSAVFFVHLPHQACQSWPLQPAPLS